MCAWVFPTNKSDSQQVEVISGYFDDWIIDTLQKIRTSLMRSDITMASMRWHQSDITPSLERSMWHQTTSCGEKPKAGGPRVQICNPSDPSNPSNETNAHIRSYFGWYGMSYFALYEISYFAVDPTKMNWQKPCWRRRKVIEERLAVLYLYRIVLEPTLVW